MLDLVALRTVRRHGDDWSESRCVEHHDPSQHDPKRECLKDGQDFRCECGETVTLLPPGDPALPGEHLGQIRFGTYRAAEIDVEIG